MSATIRIRSTKGLKKICGKLIGKKWESVDANKFIKWKDSRMGKIVFKECIEVFSDVKSSKKIESAELQSLRATRATDKTRIKTLEQENADLKARVIELEGMVEAAQEVSPSEDVETEEVDTDQESEPKEFTFDPEIHTIDHRGGGSYFVMDLEDNKVYGPLTDAEKEKFNKMVDEA